MHFRRDSYRLEEVVKNGFRNDVFYNNVIARKQLVTRSRIKIVDQGLKRKVM